MKRDRAYGRVWCGDRFIDAARLAEKQQTTTDGSGCVNWTGPLNNAGYGMLGFKRDLEPRSKSKGMMTAHRAAWQLANNSAIPDGKWIIHSCHNRTCINPDHLSVGTRPEKRAAMARDGRLGNSYNHPNWACPDRTNWHLNFKRKWTDEQIQFLRAAHPDAIAQEFEVDIKRARQMRITARVGFKWLPYDRENTKLK